MEGGHVDPDRRQRWRVWVRNLLTGRLASGRATDLVEVPDQATAVTRLAVGLGLSATAVVAVARLLPGWHDLRASGHIVDGFVALFALVSLGMWFGLRRGWTLPPAGQYLLVLGATAATAVGSYVAGGAEGTAIGTVFALTTAMAVMHFPSRWVLAQRSLVIVGYGLAVAAGGGTPAQWLLIVGLTGSAGYLAGRLQYQTTRLAERMQASEQWRAALMSTLAHDLRSPLTTIRGTVDLLRTRQGELSAEQVGSLYEALHRQADKAMRLTADLLDHERASSGRLELDRRLVSLEAAVEDALAGVPDADVSCDIPRDLKVEVDPDRFEQILVNLLTNAVRYGEEPIEVTARPDPTGPVRVAVRDHGPGIPRQTRARLFGHFSRDDSHPDSIGLGLWIVEQLAQAHGASVAYEDADPGARFVLTLPATNGEARAARP